MQLYTGQFPLNANHFNLSVDSDWHANYDSANLQATVKQNYSEYIDDRICLGDVLNLRATEDTEDQFLYWDDELLILGNHDMISAPTGWNWLEQPTSREAYERWYAPYIDTNGINIEPDKLFWQKEYREKKVLLIGGYCMYPSSVDREEQYEFFNAMLNYALDSELSVIIAYHWAFRNMTVKHCSFTNARKLNQMNCHDSILPDLLYPYEERLHELVESYIDRGLNFICWLNGHRHTDEILTKGRQLHILIGSTKYDSGNRVWRIEDTPTEALMNVVTYNTHTGLIEIRRYGASARSYGGLRKMLFITREGEVIFDYGHEDDVV